MLKKAPPPMPKVLGKTDPMYPGLALIEVGKAPKHPAFHKMNVRMIPPRTFYLFNRKTNKIEGVTTRIEWQYTPFYMGWDNCGVCHSHMLHCDCPGGMSAPRSIEYVYDHETAILNGEEWGVHHPNYMGSFTRAEREARADSPVRPTWVNDTGKAIQTARTPARPLQAGAKHLVAKVTNAPYVPKTKKLLTKSDSVSSDTVLHGEVVDMEALDRETSSSVEEMISHVTKRLSKTTNTTKKVLKKKGE